MLREMYPSLDITLGFCGDCCRLEVGASLTLKQRRRLPWRLCLWCPASFHGEEKLLCVFLIPALFSASGRDCCQLASDSCPGRAPWVPKLAARCRHGASLGAAGAAAGSGNNPLMPGAVSARFLEAAEGRPANCRPEPGGEDAAGAGEGAEAGRESLVVPEGCKGPQRQSGTGMVTEEMPPPAGSAAMVEKLTEMDALGFSVQRSNPAPASCP
ncbi:uncharacterized protein M6G45_014399 isoform 1-T1 [Spheniscus humboldti]